MELKQLTTEYQNLKKVLLIVPYGIETCLAHCCAVAQHLLIVPYGIETISLLLLYIFNLLLLIVPYGIETDNGYERYKAALFPFNRTLWN